MKRFFQLSALVAMVALLGSCSGGGMSSLDDGEAAVFLTVSDFDYGGGAIVTVCDGGDMYMASITITSNPRSPETPLGPAQDVVLTRWVVTPYRTDGGTVASPVWIHDLSVTVPAGGQTTLTDFPFYPDYLYDDPPLSYLFPENGGFDPETGERRIEQGLRVVWYGRTMSGKSVTLEFTLFAEFTCQ